MWVLYRIDEIQSIVVTAAAALPISKVTLVGSYAKNAATAGSDIDLIIDGEDLSDAYWDFLFALENAFSVKVDVVTARGVKNSSIGSSLAQGGIILYET